MLPLAKNCWKEETAVVDVAMKAGATGALNATRFVVVAFVVVELVAVSPKIVARFEVKFAIVPVMEFKREV